MAVAPSGGQGINMKPVPTKYVRELADLLVEGFEDWSDLGHIYVREHDSYPLVLFNYTAEAQFEGRWNVYERASRGLILNAETGEIVARPFDKFLNWGERGHVGNGHIVTVTEKMDGSLGILYRLDGRYRICTRGSFDSEQAQWATRFLDGPVLEASLPDQLTLLFEIIYPDNRIVVDYGDRQDLVLIGARNRYTGEYLPYYPDLYDIACRYDFSLPRTYTFNSITEIIEETGRIDENEEGWVVEMSDGSLWKFKGDRYREIHRLIHSLSFKNTLRAIRDDRIGFVLEAVPDEFLDDVYEWIEEIETTRGGIIKRVERLHDEAPKETRKAYALWVQEECPEMAPYMFARRDGYDLTPLIYKLAFKDREEQVDGNG